MNLELLKRFYAIAQEGNLTRTAEKMNLAQSALTQSILAFENQMKTKLFERTRQGMVLTPQGERLYVFASRLLEETYAFEKTFREQDEIVGELRIMTTPFVGAEWLVPALDEFLNDYPDIRVKIFLESDDINPSRTDVAICTFIPHQPHLIQKPLLTSKIKLFASQAYLDKHGTPQSAQDLDHHRLITYRGNYSTIYGSTNWLINLENTKRTARESYLEVNSLHGMLRSALQGYGIVELPDHQYVLESGLKEVLPHLACEDLSMYYIFADNRKKSKKINMLFEYLRRKIDKNK